MRSTPAVLRGAAAGRKRRGALSVTLSAAGKAMMEEGVTALLALEVALQGSSASGAAAAGAALHAPAVAAVVDALAQHSHAAQPGVSSAEEAQQQPPPQRFVPQSAFEAHASPGELSMQAPASRVQEAQPCRAALGEQQKPPRHARVEQKEEELQGAPGGSGPGGARLTEAVAVALPVRVPLGVRLLEGVPLGVGGEVPVAVPVRDRLPVVEGDAPGDSVGVAVAAAALGRLAMRIRLLP